MKTRIQGVIHKGIWPGVGDVYDIKVNAGYATIIVKSGEDLKKRAKDTQKRFSTGKIKGVLSFMGETFYE